MIQSVGLRDRISRATNTQTAILAEDSFANEAEQRKIHDLMSRRTPPYFYAPKRGSWEQLKPPAKKVYEDKERIYRKYRKLTSRELAAVCLAIFGEPESAKDRPAKITFEKVDGKDSEVYERIFKSRNVAAQWLLPFELFRHANALFKRELSKDPDSDRARIGEYGRYRMVHLAYGYLRELVGDKSSAKPPDFLSASVSEDLLTRANDWAPNLLEVTLDALVDGFSETQARGDKGGLREFFREKKHQGLLNDRFQEELQKTERVARRTGKSLSQFLGVGDGT
ncbi:MAG: AIPR family protein [Proteobacteria bacterium]|nr:AIPR family protein [Pseudomonadota bacterium]